MAENIPEWAKQAKQEASDAEQRKKDTAAYDKASPEPDTTFGKLKSVIRKAKGGTASARADGIAQRGKTRGIMVACGGGYMKGKK
jgi:hypothetical protein